MSSPVKIERLTRAMVVSVAGTASSTPGTPPSNATEVEVSLGERVPLDAAISCGYIGDTAAQRPVTHLLSAYIKHNDPTKLVYRWNQISGSAAAIPAGQYKFHISW